MTMETAFVHCKRMLGRYYDIVLSKMLVVYRSQSVDAQFDTFRMIIFVCIIWPYVHENRFVPYI